MNTPAWWPPCVGDRLRHFTLHDTQPHGVHQVEALVKVVAVFEHNHETRIVGAEWFPGRQRWSYEVFTVCAAFAGLIWPDGEPRPRQDQPRG